LPQSTSGETKAAPDAGILTTDFDWSMLRRAIEPLAALPSRSGAIVLAADARRDWWNPP